MFYDLADKTALGAYLSDTVSEFAAREADVTARGAEEEKKEVTARREDGQAYRASVRSEGRNRIDVRKDVFARPDGNFVVKAYVPGFIYAIRFQKGCADALGLSAEASEVTVEVERGLDFEKASEKVDKAIEAALLDAIEKGTPSKNGRVRADFAVSHRKER